MKHHSPTAAQIARLHHMSMCIAELICRWDKCCPTCSFRIRAAKSLQPINGWRETHQRGCSGRLRLCRLEHQRKLLAPPERALSCVNVSDEGRRLPGARAESPFTLFTLPCLLHALESVQAAGQDTLSGDDLQDEHHHDGQHRDAPIPGFLHGSKHATGHPPDSLACLTALVPWSVARSSGAQKMRFKDSGQCSQRQQIIHLVHPLASTAHCTANRSRHEGS